jgi:hypothetical protein
MALTTQTINIGGQPEFRGELKFEGSNNIGPNLVIDLPNVSFAPTAAINFIGDAYGLLELTGEVLADPVTGLFGTITYPDDTITSPTVLGYYVGTGIVSWKGLTDVDFIDLGNVDVFEVTPAVERLPHWNHRVGIRRQDFNPVVQQTCTCRVTMDEFTAQNLKMAFLATVT